MGYLSDLKKKVERLDFTDIGTSAVANRENELEDLQRDQMMHGEGADGNKLGQYKNESYAIYKHGLNPEAGFPFKDLRKTGAFQNKIEAHIVGDEIILESTDPKAAEVLALTENKNVFGLNSEYTKLYIDESLRPEFHNLIKKTLRLK